MKNKIILIVILLLFLALVNFTATAQQGVNPDSVQSTNMAGSGFTYQGKLEDSSGLVNDSCDFMFSLYRDSGGLEQLGSSQFFNGVTVSGGLFTITNLDFGWEVFNGEERYLSIAVRCPSGSGDYASLAPLQSIAPAPYALALPGMRTTPGDQGPNVIGGLPDNQVKDGVYGGTIAGGGVTWGYNFVYDHAATVGGGANNQAGSDDTDFWNADGATVSGGWNNAASAPISTVGGGADNNANAYAATVCGGQSNHAEDGNATICGGFGNYLTGYDTTIAGGNSNAIYWGWASTIGGGITNTITTDVAVISGGRNNTIEGSNGTIGGGAYNTISGTNSNTIAGGFANYVTGDVNTVAGGAINEIYASDNAFIGGGWQNTTSGAFSAITGGVTNTIDITGTYATISGGQGNQVSGFAGTVPGGVSNTAAGDYSFAAGKNAKANHRGSFVWSDSRFDSDFESLRENQFRVQSSGGAQFSNGDGAWIEFLWEDLISSSSGAFLSRGGSWTNASDVNLKENFAPVDRIAVLEKLNDIPTQIWNYKSEGAEIRHLGPTAQDFYAAFELGGTDKAISTIDADGISLAAIQGLYELAQDQAATIDDLNHQNADLEARIAALENNRLHQNLFMQLAPWILGVVALLVSLAGKIPGRRFNFPFSLRKCG